jgi:hypothetical protein
MQHIIEGWIDAADVGLGQAAADMRAVDAAEELI